MPRLALVGLLLLCSVALPAADDLPAQYNPEKKNAEADALQVWRLGAKYFGEQAVATARQTPPDNAPEYTFSGFDPVRTSRFLNGGEKLKPVVMINCAVTNTAYEDGLEKVLKSGTPELKLQALALLVRVKAPKSVALQWRVLKELKAHNFGAHGKALVGELGNAFKPGPLLALIKQIPPAPEPPKNGEAVPMLRRTNGPPFAGERDVQDVYWTIRALGVQGNVEGLPQLADMACSTDPQVSHAAVYSLEELTGDAADQALAKAVAAWNAAYLPAGEALFHRNKALLAKTLATAVAPPQLRHQQGLWLARCDDAKAVPILCATVKDVELLDGEMFDQIERLAAKDHLALIRNLALHVREDQKERAAEVVKACEAKLAK